MGRKESDGWHVEDHMAESLHVVQGSAVTMDFREDRVRVFVDSQQMVVAEPRIG